MRKVLLLVAVALWAGCTPMRAVKGSTRTFLTEAGTTIAFERVEGDVTQAVLQLFGDRGFMEFKRAEVSPTNKVIFLKGTRDRINRRRDSVGQQSFISQDIGSWFAVRVVTDGPKTTLSFYGKPTVYGAEGCGDGDRELRDTGYECTPLEKRADWPGHQLVEGREETQVISTIVAQLGERFPMR